MVFYRSHGQEHRLWIGHTICPQETTKRNLFKKGKEKDINYYVCFWKNILPDAIVSNESPRQSLLLERGSDILRLE
jgi:hypothetical protein